MTGLIPLFILKCKKPWEIQGLEPTMKKLFT